LRETYMPAVLIETMFISNLQEEERLNDLQWQEDFTTHLSKIIPNYLGYERVREEEEKHYAQDAFDMWKEKGIVFEDHDLNVPITWGEYVITQHRLRNIE
ncbi:MAG: N-acetylmuramoyl-L-alanine amidase, partial [Clostridia bacterium]